MINKEQMDNFVREGFKRYPDAKDAVKSFENEMQDRLGRLLEGKKDWQHFKPRAGGRGLRKDISRNTGPRSEKWISIYKESEDENGGMIGFGFWWKSKAAPDGVVLYIEFWLNEPKPLQLSKPEWPVQCAPLDNKNIKYLYVVVGNGFDLDKMGNLLLAEADRALGENVHNR